MNKIQFVLALLILLATFQLQAQNNSSSPYSRYGIGDIANQRFGQFQGIGGTSIGIRNSYHLNFTNPASYTAIDTLSFIWEFGVNGKYNKLSTSSLSQEKYDANFAYMIAGFPINSWWYSGFGLLPYSNVGYTITSDSIYSTAWGDTMILDSHYSGSGGINQVYWGNAFKLSKNFSLGFNIKYLFGTIDHTRTANVLNSDGQINPDNFSVKESQQLVISDFTYDLGFQYKNKINKKLGYTAGLVFSSESKINAFESVFTEKVNAYGFTDTITNTEGEKDHFLLPLNLGTGFSIYNERFLFAADYSIQNWANSTFLGKKDSLVNLSRISAGMEFIPNYRSLKYLARIRYRIGAKYEKSYLNLNGQQLTDYSLSCGLGLPLRKRKSTININFEIGKRGTNSNNLIQENYGLISINLSLHDIWFVRRKFD
ncbi:MAG: hypothetical protein U9R19_09145 [Bacteroidota bacterium]|nr:hypothetical protein [Bacteroidota bacterium]